MNFLSADSASSGSSACLCFAASFSGSKRVQRVSRVSAAESARLPGLPVKPWVSASYSLAPFAALFEWPGGRIILEDNALHFAGAIITLLGIGGVLLAQTSMGNSWRIGVDESEKTQLVTGGLFAWMRNPIFSFVLLSVAGFVLLVPSLFTDLAAALTILGIELQVRIVEEPYLRVTHGPDYADYAAKVGRFVPGLGWIPNESTRS